MVYIQRGAHDGVYTAGSTLRGIYSGEHPERYIPWWVPLYLPWWYPPTYPGGTLLPHPGYTRTSHGLHCRTGPAQHWLGVQGGSPGLSKGRRPWAGSLSSLPFSKGVREEGRLCAEFPALPRDKSRKIG